MASTSPDGNVATLDQRTLRPFISFLILEYLGDDPAVALGLVLDVMRRHVSRDRGSSRAILLAAGFDDHNAVSSATDADVVERMDGFSYQRHTTPSWATKDSGLTNVTNEIALVYQRRTLIAVHADGPVRDAVLRWIRGDAKPPFRCVPTAIVHDAFLRGEAKSLWLNGVHPRRNTRADTKSISGQRLQDALSPIEDSTFALRSARSALEPDGRRTSLVGIVGTTPSDALIWSRQSASLQDFVSAARETLELVHDTMSTGTGLDQPFPLLATTLDSLSGVANAYELMVLDAADLPPGASDETLDAAELLQTSIVDVAGDADGANFTLLIGRAGIVMGELRATLMMENGHVHIRFGHARQPTDEQLVRSVMDALVHTELLSIYYASGHVVTNNTVCRRQHQSAPFRGWKSIDFTGYDIAREKPDGASSAEIHAAIGEANDQSLFGWVARHYTSGWLTCDDGTGEAADFIHLSYDGTLTFIHVKAAHSSGPGRRVAAGPYEVVASQATKNLHYLSDSDALADHLSKSPLQAPAAWVDGVRAANRDDLIEALRCRSARDQSEVVIVQPHVSQLVLDRVHADGDDASPSLEQLRLNLLEMLLNATRATVVGMSADLTVVTSNE